MIRAVQICNGLGAGNIGDEFMARAFWDAIPGEIELDVALFPESSRQHEPYPRRHLYRPVLWDGDENEGRAAAPGLLVGDTPVTDAEGLHWPMQFLASRLQRFHNLGQPVDAVGVGVDRALDSQGRRLFQDHFLPIRSWTVRSTVCKEALISLGVSESSVRVGADWAWLYTPRRDLREWARAFWTRLGIDPGAPLLVANVVNMQWRGLREAKQALAAALDWAVERFGLQVAFFCNECRSGEFFDFEAATELAALMRTRSVLAPNDYYSPDETLALLSFATVTLAQRYHFLVESVTAGCAPVGVLRGEKMKGLAAELSLPDAGAVDNIDQDRLTHSITQTLENRVAILDRLADTRRQLARRALDNVAFLRKLPPYDAAGWSG